ncbi:MAG: exopolyphosphatase [Planctomycetota bacterium]|nr:exopolyphosphatase [Planctomycetota bacterium]
MKQDQKPIPEEESANRLVAVIDIGATSIRMAISQIDQRGVIHNLESLSQAVSLGKDCFILGRIESETIEECVRVLKIYRTKLDEFGISEPGDIQVVATSAVRESRNRLLFLDRVFIATGFEVEPFDEAELHRVTFLGIQPLLRQREDLANSTNVICEIGGGSTEMLVVESGNVLFSETFRLGSLRLRKSLEAISGPMSELPNIMKEQVRQMANRFKRSIPKLKNPQFIGMGGDLRFAAAQMYSDDQESELRELKIGEFEEFANSIVAKSPDELVNQYSVSLPEAESLGPSLLAYAQLVKALRLDSFHVSNTNLRDGLVREMILPEVWGKEFREQVIRYSLNLGRMYKFDEVYSTHVADLSHALFRELHSEHGLDRKHELILYLAALLHEIGQFVNQRGYHKHTLYLIRNSDFFGLGQKDILLVSLVARYHRRAHPQPSHDGYTSLDRVDRITVSKLAALLRIAISLNVTRQQKVSEMQAEIGSEWIQLRIPSTELSLEKLAIQSAGTLFNETFGKRITITEA